jgi:hypothetical protein
MKILLIACFLAVTGCSALTMEGRTHRKSTPELKLRREQLAEQLSGWRFGPGVRDEIKDLREEKEEVERELLRRGEL